MFHPHLETKRLKNAIAGELVKLKAGPGHLYGFVAAHDDGQGLVTFDKNNNETMLGWSPSPPPDRHVISIAKHFSFEIDIESLTIESSRFEYPPGAIIVVGSQLFMALNSSGFISTPFVCLNHFQIKAVPEASYVGYAPAWTLNIDGASESSLPKNILTYRTAFELS